MHSLLPELAGHPTHWKDLSQQLFKGTGSFGNGAAMRITPVGAYFADDLEAVVKQAHLSAQITHSHPEGAAGAIAVAPLSLVDTKLRHSLPAISCSKSATALPNAKCSVASPLR